MKNGKYFLKLIFSFQIKKRIMKFLFQFFAFIFELGQVKVCFDRWIVK